MGRPSGRETSSHRWLCPATQQHRCSQTQQVACLPWPCVLRMMVGWAVAGAPELEKGAVIERLGFIAGQIDELNYRMGFSLRGGMGTLVPCRRSRAPRAAPAQ